MKIIRPQNNTPTKKQLLDEKTAISQECKLYDEELVDDNTSIEIVKPTPVPVQVDLTIENLMAEIIKQKDDKVQVTISLTKRQYDLYLKRGGESWVKKVITGQQHVKRTNKNKR